MAVSIKAALKARLNSQIPAANGRIYPGELPPNESSPSMVYEFVSNEELGRELEVDAEGDRVAKAIFRLWCLSRLALGYKAVEAMEEQLRDTTKFDGVSGNWTYTSDGGSLQSIPVQHCRIEELSDGAVPPVAAGDLITHIRGVDLVVVYGH